MQPFITITDDNKIVMAGQFWIFGAVAGPITLLIVVLWVLWIQRREISNLVAGKRTIQFA